MGDSNFGMKISQPGYDIGSAADFDLYFSSSWPQLKIEKTGLLNATGDTSKDIITHNLGYPPLTFAMINQAGFYGADTRGFSPEVATLDSKKVVFGNYPFTLPAGTTVRYVIFRLPINQPFTAVSTNIGTAPQTVINHDLGFKVAKSGKSADSKDYRDFTLHTGTRSPMLHTIVYDKIAKITSGEYTSSNGLEWTIDVPYLPIFFVYYSSDGETFSMLSTIAQTTPKVNFNTTEGHIDRIVLNAGPSSNPPSGYGSIVVLKDPIDVPNVTEVTI